MELIQTVYDLIGIRYRLYAILEGPDADCKRSNRDPIQTVYVPMVIRYRLCTIL